MEKFSVSLLFLLIFSSVVAAQPSLQVFPEEIEYNDAFQRLQNIWIKNTGTAPLTVDSINYGNRYYFIRFDKVRWWPFQVNPGDSVMMDCIIPGYYSVPPGDMTDTMNIYGNNEEIPQRVRVRINYVENYRDGIIQGQVDSPGGTVDSVNVYIFYKGNYLIQSIAAGENGSYSVSLPPGWYTVAAAKDSFRTTFWGQQYDLMNAGLFYLHSDSVMTADITLTPAENYSGSVSGTILDSLSGLPLRRAVVVVRKGNHTPTKTRAEPAAGEAYTGFLKPDGTYSVSDISPGYYYIQSFSDFFVPSYYKSGGSANYWQSADSVYIDSGLSGFDIFMQRDSSLGNGSVTGKVSIGSESSPASDVIVYAEALNTLNSIFNYTFISDSGNFNISFLPYGDYRLVAQKAGYFDAYSNNFTIDSQHTAVSGINLLLSPATSVNDKEIIPETITLYQNYPNPFNPSTTIEFYLPSGTEVTLKILNVLGEEVALLNNGFLTSGFHSRVFNASGLSSGMYVVSLSAGSFISARKILLLK